METLFFPYYEYEFNDNLNCRDTGAKNKVTRFESSDSTTAAASFDFVEHPVFFEFVPLLLAASSERDTRDKEPLHSSCNNPPLPCAMGQRDLPQRTHST